MRGEDHDPSLMPNDEVFRDRPSSSFESNKVGPKRQFFQSIVAGVTTDHTHPVQPPTTDLIFKKLVIYRACVSLRTHHGSNSNSTRPNLSSADRVSSRTTDPTNRSVGEVRSDLAPQVPHDQQRRTVMKYPKENSQRRGHSRYRIWSYGKNPESIPLLPMYTATGKQYTSFGTN